ncbi:MAG: peptidoglycan-binding protein [Proteobacteria bacterium]|nr:peptidoglycan-binding protein [Pseudomonadota bacterium]
MRSWIFFIFVAAGISGFWLIIPMFQGRDANFEYRLVGALKVVEEKIEASSPEVVDADVFYSPSMEAAGRDNLWILTGIAAVKNLAGETANRRYTAVLETTCEFHADPDCWRLEELILEEQILVLRESVAAGPGGTGGEIPATPSEATSTLSSKAPRTAASQVLSGQVLSEQSKTVKASEAADSDIAEVTNNGRSTNVDGQVKGFGQRQLSFAPPADPARDTPPSSTEAAWIRLDRTHMVLIQSRLKRLGFELGLLDGIIGPRTVAAIEDYQRAQGLTVDGKPTRELLTHLGQQSLVPGPRTETRSGTKVLKMAPVTAVHRASSADTRDTDADNSLRPSAKSFQVSPSLSSGPDDGARSITVTAAKTIPAAKTITAENETPDTVSPRATLGNESLLFLTRSRLRQLGFEPGPLSTEFGPQARTAINEFQRENGLPVDGQPTWGLLDHLERVVLARSRTGEEGAGAGSSGEPKARASGYEHFKMGFAAAKDGTEDLAIEHYTRAIYVGDLSQEHLAYAFNNRGQGYFLKGLLDQAIKDFDKAVQLSPSYSTAYHNRGLVYHKKGLYNRADDDYSKAIRLKPDMSYAYFNRGGMYEAKGEQQNALQDFQKAYSLDPSSAIYQTKMKELGLLN